MRKRNEHIRRHFLESVKATEKYLVDTAVIICQDLGEILISEDADESVTAHVERAEEYLEDLRKWREQKEQKREKNRQINNYVNTVQCGGCPVLVDLLVNYPKTAQRLSIMFTLDGDKNGVPVPNWHASVCPSDKKDSIGEKGGCLRALLEAQEFTQQTGVELAHCQRFAEGIGCGFSPVAAGQEV